MSLKKDVYGTIVCFGDSLVQYGCRPGGFVARLQDVYQRKLDVVNRGFSGYTSRQAKDLCPLLFSTDATDDARPPKLVILWFGTNDSIRDSFGQHVPLDEYRENMRSIIRFLSTSPLLVLTPGAVLPNAMDGHERSENKRAYADVIHELAQEDPTRIAVLDILDLFEKGSHKRILEELLDSDGVHISGVGYEVVFDGVMDAIRKSNSSLIPVNLPYVFPYWRDLDLGQDSEGQKKQLHPICNA